MAQFLPRNLVLPTLCLFVYSLWHLNLRFKKIVVHCTDSTFANRDLIHLWHLERGWSEIGYNYVILNGHPLPQIERPFEDGRIEIGRSLARLGAHARGDNMDSIGIALVGKREFSTAQLDTLMLTLRRLMTHYNISPDGVFGHYELQSGILQGKTCPNLDMNHLRKHLREGNDELRI